MKKQLDESCDHQHQIWTSGGDFCVYCGKDIIQINTTKSGKNFVKMSIGDKTT